MPEGDTLFRTATVLRRTLVGATVRSALAWPGPLIGRVPDLSVLSGTRITSVESRGKHLLITFQAGQRRLTLRSQLRMTGSWHRYRPGEPWRLPHRRATVEIQTEAEVAVCFDCPTVELLTDGDLKRSRPLRTLGPDLLAPSLDLDAAVANLPASPQLAIGEALLDQRLVAGVGNVVRNEVLFMERVNPWTPVAAIGPAGLQRLIETAASVLRGGASSGRRVTTGDHHRGAALWVYRRAGRPCRRCGSLIRSAPQGGLARIAYWCPRCQA